MSAKKIWIASHPELIDRKDVRFDKPRESGTYLESYLEDVDPAWCEWKEYIVISVDSDWTIS